MTIPFDRDFDPVHGAAVQVAPGLRRVTANNPGPFTFHGTNAYLLGEREVTVVDPGPDDPAQTQALLAAAGSGRIAAILVTHGHRDHTPGARRLSALTGAPVLAAAPGPVSAGALDHGVDPDHRPDRILADGEVVPTEVGPLRALATPGHAADHLCFALEGTPHLLSGDHVMAWATSVVAHPDGSMADYMTSLDRLAGRPETVYWPGHGGPVRDGPAFVAALRAHRIEREAAILAAVRAGARDVPSIVRAVYVGLDPALAGAAGLSVGAHLAWLADKGLVAVDETGAVRPR